jgi:hypothetical protein
VTFAFPAGTVLAQELHNTVNVTWFLKDVSGRTDQYEDVVDLKLPPHSAYRLVFLKDDPATYRHEAVHPADLPSIYRYCKPPADRAELLAAVRNIRAEIARRQGGDTTLGVRIGLKRLDTLTPLLAPKRPAVRFIVVED